MDPCYWLVLPNGGRQRIDPRRFDLAAVEERARRLGGRLEVEPAGHGLAGVAAAAPAPPVSRAFEPPLGAVGALFRARLEQVHACAVPFALEINHRPTERVLGGYYKRRRLVRIYSHDRKSGRRPLEELFDTFLHEVAHHLEYTEPASFDGVACQRVPGRMHSALFWHILGALKRRWERVQRLAAATGRAGPAGEG